MAQAVVAVGVWIAANPGTAIAIAASFASAVSSAVMAKKAKSVNSLDPSDRKQILRASSAPKNYIYGQVRSSGVWVFAQEQSGDQVDGEWLHCVFAISGFPIHSAGEIKLNEESIDNFSNHVTYDVHPKGTDKASQFLIDNCSSWKSTMIGKGVGWMRLSLKFDQEKFPTGIPNVTLLKKGIEVFDPRTGVTAWSDNPVLCILDYLKRKGWDDEYLIIETFKFAASICDEVVTNSDGTKEKRYRIGCEFDDSETPEEVLKSMLSTCGGEWVKIGGRLGIRVASYYGAATMNITSADIIAPIEIQPEQERSDSFNTVRGTFVDPEQNYTEVDYPEVKVEEWVSNDGEEIVMDMNLNYVQSAFQAQRLSDIALNRSRLGMALKLPCNLRGFQATPGTMINLSLPEIGFNDHEFMVVDWEFSISGGVNLVVRRDLPDFYDDDIGNAMTPPPLIELPTGGIAAPRNPVYTAKPIGDVVQGVISWVNPSFKLASVSVIVKDNAGFVIQTASVPFPGNSIELNGKLAGQYRVELQSIGVNGAKSEVTVMSINISAPQTPDFVSVKASNWSVHLIPGYNAGGTPFGTIFEFYVSDTESNTAPNREPDEIASSWNQGGLTPDTNYYYWIRAVNSYGKSGWTKKTVKTTKEQDLVTTVVERLESIEIVSSNYVEGKTGYKINPDGTAEFNSVKTRGDLYAKSLTFMSGAAIPPIIDNSNVTLKSVGAYPNQSELQISSSNYQQGRRGWAIDANGNCEFFNATVRGIVYADGGEFHGTVYAKNIVGDVVASSSKKINGGKLTSGAEKTIVSFSVDKQESDLERYFTLYNFYYTLSASARGSGPNQSSTSRGWASIRMYIDGKMTSEKRISVYASGTASSPGYETISRPEALTLKLPVNKSSTTKVELKCYFYIDEGIVGFSVDSGYMTALLCPESGIFG